MSMSQLELDFAGRGRERSKSHSRTKSSPTASRRHSPYPSPSPDTNTPLPFSNYGDDVSDCEGYSPSSADAIVKEDVTTDKTRAAADKRRVHESKFKCDHCASTFTTKFKRDRELFTLAT